MFWYIICRSCAVLRDWWRTQLEAFSNHMRSNAILLPACLRHLFIFGVLYFSNWHYNLSKTRNTSSLKRYTEIVGFCQSFSLSIYCLLLYFTEKVNQLYRISCYCAQHCTSLFSIVDPVVSDLRRVVGDDKFNPESPQHICNMLLTTVYMASSNSSEHTRTLAKTLASQIGRFDDFIVCKCLCAVFEL